MVNCLTEKYLHILSDFAKPRPFEGKNILKVPNQLNKPKVVLFDIYDTLMASAIGDLEAQVKLKTSPDSFIKTAEKFGFGSSIGEKWCELFFSAIEAEHEFNRKLGISRCEVLVEEIWQDILNETISEGEIQNIHVKDVAIYRELVANPVAPFQGIIELWNKLLSHSIKIGIVSNAQFYTLPILAWLLDINLDEYLHKDLVIMSYELGFAKPDPHFFRYVETRIRRLGFVPQDVWIVGNDPVNDIEASKPFGFTAILFAGKSSVPPSQEKIDAIVGSYKNIEEIFDKL